MKAWKNIGIGIVFAAALLLISAHLFSQRTAPEGSAELRDIVSFCVGDANGNGTDDLLAISGSGKTDEGERNGQFLLICDASAKEDLDTLGYIPPEKIRNRIDLAPIRPMKVQLGDVNGDGINEVSICVYKTTKFHPVLAKRPFFFDLKNGNLIPFWLGSRLSRPFDDYILRDLDGDGADEIISIEELENGGRVLALYNWRGFGFEMLTESKEYDGTLRFAYDPAEQAGEGEIRAVLSSYGEQKALVFRLKDERFIFAE
ncbi:hypothetical protein [Papillibacter cinnamivorans]|uniref:Repeat domain-containing protein n=1 Tax=Papillibacter cinnamivorans DSM 12816 TaxID=1122930 RepID=A0A1W1YE94_9FIRM|nr:hypothetical protein [Papillibacter cinnamivorans]SMC34466.1 hypothetical protein SAMN02745168_0361 [Papillibacter cinnamivorans DSM 12816]